VEDIDHRYVSGVQVLRELSRIQGRASGGLMPVVFTSTLNQDTDDESFPLHWLGERVYEITQTSQVLLDVQVAEEAGTLVFNWDAVEDLFPVGILDDMFAAYADLLQHLADEAQSWQATIPQLIPAAQVSQLAAINATDAPVSNELLHSLFTAQVSQHPEQVAVVSGDRTLTYQELSQRANQLGEQLRKLGAYPNQLVAVVMEKGWEQVVGVLGILFSGAAYVPIDPGLPQERRSQLLSQANVKLVVTQSWLDSGWETNRQGAEDAEKAEKERERIWSPDVQRICVDTLDGNSDRILEPIQQPEDLAYVIYTSGSTGQPKGVMIDHQGAVNTVLDINQRFGVNACDRVLALSSLSFDLSVYDIFGTLAAGGTIIIPDSNATQDPAHWAELIVRESITVWNSVPALMQMMVEYAISRPSILASLRLVLLSGDWLPSTLPTQLQNLVKGIQVISLGGATEASIWSILYPISQVDPAWKSIPYGKPMQNQRFYVLNQALEVCPVWVTGQLYIGGVGLAKGYWQDELKTAASFIIHPRTGERLYRTGDLGRYLPDGTIEFLGREDFQVKIGGYRIELGEIEAALEQHSAVKEAVVIALGQYKRLAAYVVLNAEENGDSDSVISSKLRCFLGDKLPHYMVPVRFVLLDFLPLTPNGKVNRQALAELDRDQEVAVDVAPRTDTEKALAQMWGKILSLPQVGINSNFFELGGDSLLATQVISQVRERWQVELPLRSLFEYPAIAQFSKEIEQAKPQNLEVSPNVITAVSRNLYRKSNNSQGLKSLAHSESPLKRTKKIEN
jgi:amino acid adenylation domain-containing protein